MERHIMTWQREHPHDGLHPLFDDILRRQLMLGGGKNQDRNTEGDVAKSAVRKTVAPRATTN